VTSTQPTDPPPTGPPPTALQPTELPPTDADLAAALADTGYRYTDPVNDPTVPGITAADPANLPDAFPPDAECHA
jgi:hypothetical protein